MRKTTVLQAVTAAALLATGAAASAQTVLKMGYAVAQNSH